MVSAAIGGGGEPVDDRTTAIGRLRSHDQRRARRPQLRDRGQCRHPQPRQVRPPGRCHHDGLSGGRSGGAHRIRAAGVDDHGRTARRTEPNGARCRRCRPAVQGGAQYRRFGSGTGQRPATCRDDDGARHGACAHRRAARPAGSDRIGRPRRSRARIDRRSRPVGHHRPTAGASSPPPKAGSTDC